MDREQGALIVKRSRDQQEKLLVRADSMYGGFVTTLDYAAFDAIAAALEAEHAAELERLRELLIDVLGTALSSDEMRLLMVGIGGTRVSSELHARCDKMKDLSARARALLLPNAPRPGEGSRPTK